ncbi:hypothetical protein N7376_17370 [Brucella intermedia GD04153]|uniref:Uncharacterized protein n=1 Tax=Brucella intermedia GD04153 TaxID=2975438 RepID=A0AA42GZT7_9HYPH|nr:hypothetical protein [Brucella intermedia]MDH0125775.1 hypothetical protein [Brucella intermedia GD04153]
MQENLTDVALELSDRIRAACDNGQYSEEIGVTITRLLTSEGDSSVDVLAALSVCSSILQNILDSRKCDRDLCFQLGQSQILMGKAIDILERQTGVSSGSFLGLETDAVMPLAQ